MSSRLLTISFLTAGALLLLATVAPSHPPGRSHPSRARSSWPGRTPTAPGAMSGDLVSRADALAQRADALQAQAQQLSSEAASLREQAARLAAEAARSTRISDARAEAAERLLLSLRHQIASAGAGPDPAEPALPDDPDAPAAEARPDAPPPDDVVVVGVLGPMTGPRASEGAAQREGVLLAADRVVEQAYLPESDLEVVFANDNGSPDMAGRLTRTLVADKRIDVLIAATTAECTQEAQRVTTAAGIPIITLGLAEDDPAGWTFRWQTDERTQAAKLAKWCYLRREYVRVGIVLEDTSYGRTGARELRRASADYGAVVAAQVAYAPGCTDFAAHIMSLQNSGVEAVVIWGGEVEAAAFVRAARRAGASFAMLGCDALASERFVRMAKGAAEGMVVACAFDPNAPGAESKEFAEAYRERYLRSPSSAAAHGHDALWAIAQAARDSGPSPATLRKGLAQLRGIRGATGLVAFDEQGASGQGLMLYTVRDGALRPL